MTLGARPAVALLLALGLVGGVWAGGASEPAGQTATDEAQSGAPSMPMAGGGSAGMAMAMTVLGQETWEAMTIAVAVAAPAIHSVPTGTGMAIVEVAESDTLHLMVTLSDTMSGGRIPYADIWATITDANGTIVFDERLWPMLSRMMDVHYGSNVGLPGDGDYLLRLQIGPPQVALHEEYFGLWAEAFVTEIPFHWPPEPLQM